MLMLTMHCRRAECSKCCKNTATKYKPARLSMLNNLTMLLPTILTELSMCRKGTGCRRFALSCAPVFNHRFHDGTPYKPPIAISATFVQGRRVAHRLLAVALSCGALRRSRGSVWRRRLRGGGLSRPDAAYMAQGLR